jgi:hypothetical protein
MRENWIVMRDLLEEIDADYYRAARLLIVRAELEVLRRARSTAAEAIRRRKTTSTDAAVRRLLRPATAQSVTPEVDISG